MCFMFHPFPSTSYMLVNSPRKCIVVSFSYLLSVLFRTSIAGGWLVWMKFMMGCIYFTIALLILMSFQLCPKILHLSSLYKRLPFHFHNHVSEFAFDLIHFDIWGPYAVPTIVGHKYFLTIVDDCTKLTWVYLMKSKSKTRHLLQSFYTMIKTQFGKSIKVFRTNNGLEFQMVYFFKFNGIIHQHSCVATPQQNSVMERKHQHILCVARVLKL